MTTAARAELGATLDHVCIRSNDPARLARFYEETYGMASQSDDDGWRCEAPGRIFIVRQGQPNSVEFFAYAFAHEPALQAYRDRLPDLGVAMGSSPSPLFGPAAFSVADPDGNVVVFGSRSARVSLEEPLPARIQHIAFRTARIETMLAFYRDELGFVLSDRVEDDAGVLRACFLRTNHEHHALALFGASDARLDHISSETRDMTALCGWADKVSAKRVPMHWGVGRHGPGNDLFFMVKDPDENLIEISAELEQVAPDRPTGIWPHEQRTLNLWGTAIIRS